MSNTAILKAILDACKPCCPEGSGSGSGGGLGPCCGCDRQIWPASLTCTVNLSCIATKTFTLNRVISNPDFEDCNHCTQVEGLGCAPNYVGSLEGPAGEFSASAVDCHTGIGVSVDSGIEWAVSASIECVGCIGGTSGGSGSSEGSIWLLNVAYSSFESGIYRLVGAPAPSESACHNIAKWLVFPLACDPLVFHKDLSVVCYYAGCTDCITCDSTRCTDNAGQTLILPNEAVTSLTNCVGASLIVDISE